MKKGREIINLPIIDLASGKLIGFVHDLKLEGNQKLTGLYLRTAEKELFYLPLEAIHSIGRDAVLIDGMLEKTESEHAWYEEKRVMLGLAGLNVVTSTGKNLGTLEDIIIEEADGSIWGYELSDGYLMDLVSGRRLINKSDIVTSGNELVIVEDR